MEFGEVSKRCIHCFCVPLTKSLILFQVCFSSMAPVVLCSYVRNLNVLSSTMLERHKRRNNTVMCNTSVGGRAQPPI
jgi:hypothetical protein